MTALKVPAPNLSASLLVDFQTALPQYGRFGTRASHEPGQQLADCESDLIDSGVEYGLVRQGWLAVTADFAHELQGGIADLVGCGGRFSPSQLLYVAAHVGIVVQSGPAGAGMLTSVQLPIPDVQFSMLTDDPQFWLTLDDMTKAHETIIDRPRGQPHPTFKDLIYPFDYGFLKGTSGGDGAEIDVWLGSLAGAKVTAVLCTVDPFKKDAELKVMIDCSGTDLEAISRFLRDEAELPHLIVRR